LTRPEQAARSAWNAARAAFQTANMDSWKATPGTVTNAEAVASSFLLPPDFAVNTVSGRSKVDEKRRKRNYPPTLQEWDDFEDILAPFDGSTTFRKFVSDPFKSSFLSNAVFSDEKSEEVWLDSHMWNVFVKAGMMAKKEQVQGRQVVHGLPDKAAFLLQGETAKVSAVVEIKSSQNLLLPNDFQALKTKYEGAFTAQTNKKTSTGATLHTRSANFSGI
jgi:hypothetical protein